jgi:hypothetical protein
MINSTYLLDWYVRNPPMTRSEARMMLEYRASYLEELHVRSTLLCVLVTSYVEKMLLTTWNLLKLSPTRVAKKFVM